VLVVLVVVLSTDNWTLVLELTLDVGRGRWTLDTNWYWTLVTWTLDTGTGHWCYWRLHWY